MERTIRDARARNFGPRAGRDETRENGLPASLMLIFAPAPLSRSSGAYFNPAIIRDLADKSRRYGKLEIEYLSRSLARF